MWWDITSTGQNDGLAGSNYAFSELFMLNKVIYVAYKLRLFDDEDCNANQKSAILSEWMSAEMQILHNNAFTDIERQMFEYDE